MAGPVHYELYIRRTAPSPWSLLLATESRQSAIQQAEDLLADKRAAAVRVTKETLDPDTMEFMSVTVLTRGAPEPPKPKAARDKGFESPCNAPRDLYAPAPRELIARALEEWLSRQGVCCFELMHRPDLIEKLEAAGVEYQHALQKIAIPESQATGQPVHELIRHYQKLTAAAMERVVAAGRRSQFPDLSKEPIAEVARRLDGHPDRAFLLGGAICAALAGVKGWRARLEILMDLADAAPSETQPHALVEVAIEQLLCEMMNLRSAVAEILGANLDLGASLAALVRLAAPKEVELVLKADPRLAAFIPVIDGPAARLGLRLQAGEYRLLAAALTRRTLRELTGPRRLRPTDARGEIDILRALATTLTAASGRLLSLEDVQAAFIERSKGLVTADFVDAYVGRDKSALEESQALVWLAENVTGAANKRAAGRWLAAAVTALRFEKELRAAPEGARHKLAVLAGLQRAVRAAGLSEKDDQEIGRALGAAGDVVEAEGRLLAQIARAPAPPAQKLNALLRMAAGETAPLGPAADRAKAAAVKLFKAPDSRAALTAEPETLAPLRPLMKAAGLAA